MGVPNLNSRLENESIRSKLELRWNKTYNCYEVYTTIHGTGVFRWIRLDDAGARWYAQVFELNLPEKT
jgi:hypothetical protein